MKIAVFIPSAKANGFSTDYSSYNIKNSSYHEIILIRSEALLNDTTEEQNNSHQNHYDSDDEKDIVDLI